MPDLAVTMAAIRAAVDARRWALSNHAREAAGQRQIFDEEVATCLLAGEVIEDYPDDRRGPSALVLGHSATGRPLHAVCGLEASGALVVITVYEPGLPQWRDERTRNR